MLGKLLKEPFFLLFFLLPYLWIPLQFVARCYAHTVTVYYLVASFVVALSIWLFSNLLSKKWGRVFRTIVVYLVSLYGIINAFVWCQFENILSTSVLEILLATNTREIGEFFSTYVPLRWLFIIVLLPVLYTCIYRVVQKKNIELPRWTILFFPIPFIVCIGLSIYAPVLMAQAFGCNLWTFSWADHVDLSLHQTNPNVIETRRDHPDKFVFILGESFARSHSSLYGYNHNTNPRLGELFDEGSLLCFSDVVSPATATIESVKKIFVDSSAEYGDSEMKWYDNPNLVEMCHVMGYHTSWVSNQSFMPMIDDVSTAFAHICDENHFNNEKGEGLDEFVLGFDYSTSEEKKVVIYHLMGQHGTYNKRFPNRYRVFSASDYDELLEHQRQTIADYDNATLYNDYVVSSIMKMYSHTDAVVFYFPDHGQDLYESDPKMFGHGRLGNLQSVKIGETIPFFVFTSQRFRENHPDSYITLLQKKDVFFSTSSFCKLALSIMGYQLENK